MNRKGITFKLFIITSMFFVFLISIGLVFQTVFFERFYVARKMSTLERSLDSFKSDYISGMGFDEMMERMREIGQENNAEVALIDNLNNFSIVTSSVEFQNDPVKTELMRSAISQWSTIARSYEKQLSRGETITYSIKLPQNYTSNIVKISPINSGKVTEYVIIAVSSLQPVGEAAQVTREFYVYVYGLGFILVIILSVIYSNMISKPLISITRAASKMAELDFSAKCDVKSNDEIGELAGKLNFLSEKLNNTLCELKSANEKLKEDIEKERSLEKMRKEFVAGVSHELKTPISLIEGYAEGLKENIAGEKKDFYLSVIMDESDKMGRLVTDMLDLSSLETGNFKLRPKEFCIDELAGMVFRKYSDKMKEKDIKANLDIREDGILVYGDKFRIEQVIKNFLTNAIRYTPEGGSISVVVCEQNEDALIEVENEGEHIDEKEMKNIWEKFYRIEKSRNREMGGTGLGLAISKNILLLHNSKFGVVNTEKGVKFYFTLSKA